MLFAKKLVGRSLARRVSRVAVLMACGGLVGSAFAQEARFSSIPGRSATPGSNSSFCGLSGTSGYSGTRVSEDGQVVTTVVFSPGFWDGAVPWQGARWTQGEGTTVITPDLQGLYGVVGISRDGNTIYGESWRWTAAGGYQDLRLRLTDGIFLDRLIFGCSSDGRTITGTKGTFPLESDLFRWAIDDAPSVQLPRAEEFPQGYFYFNAISGDGVVVGGSTRRFDADYNSTYAGVIVTDQGATVITDEASQAGVTDLSPDGAIAVGYLTEGPTLRAFRWTAATGTVTLDQGLVSGSYARAMNADGSVVVGDSIAFGAPGIRAWVWRAEEGFMDLQTDLTENFGLGAALSGWQLLVATDVSADGRTIVGQGVNPEGCEQAYVVRLPGATTCFADFDNSGLVNSQDFFDFLVAFFAGNSRADMNQDSFINSQDYFDFTAAFFNGC